MRRKSSNTAHFRNRSEHVERNEDASLTWRPVRRVTAKFVVANDEIRLNEYQDPILHCCQTDHLIDWLTSMSEAIKQPTRLLDHVRNTLMPAETWALKLRKRIEGHAYWEIVGSGKYHLNLVNNPWHLGHDGQASFGTSSWRSGNYFA